MLKERLAELFLQLLSCMGVLRCYLLVNTNGGGVPPGSPNLDPISDQKTLFFTPVL